MKYICTQDLYLEKYDDNGFLIENQYARVPKDSIWEKTDTSLMIGGPNSVHLERIWKIKNPKTHPWIEIDNGTLISYFKPMKQEEKHE